MGHKQQIKVSSRSTLNEAHSGYTAQWNDLKYITDQLFDKAMGVGTDYGHHQIPKACMRQPHHIPSYRAVLGSLPTALRQGGNSRSFGIIHLTRSQYLSDGK